MNLVEQQQDFPNSHTLTNVFNSNSCIDKPTQNAIPQASRNLFIEESMFVFNGNHKTNDLDEYFQNYGNESFDCFSNDLNEKKRTCVEVDHEDPDMLKSIVDNEYKNYELSTPNFDNNSENLSLFDFKNDFVAIPNKRQSLFHFERSLEERPNDLLLNRAMNSYPRVNITEFEISDAFEKSHLKQGLNGILSMNDLYQEQSNKTTGEK